MWVCAFAHSGLSVIRDACSTTTLRNPADHRAEVFHGVLLHLRQYGDLLSRMALAEFVFIHPL
jgi:hypothetical protein